MGRLGELLLVWETGHIFLVVCILDFLDIIGLISDIPSLIGGFPGAPPFFCAVS